MKTFFKITLSIIIAILITFFVIAILVDHKRLEIPQNKSERTYHPKITSMNFPLMISIHDIEKLADRKMKTILINKTIPIKKNHKNKLILKVIKTGNLHFDLDGMYVNSSIPLKIEVQFIKNIVGKNNVKIFDKKPLTLYLSAKFRSTIQLEPNMNLKASTSFTTIQWKKQPSLKFLGIEFNLKDKIDELLMGKAKEITQTIDQLVNTKINLKKVTVKIWKSIQNAMKVNTKQKDLYFRIQPLTLGAHLYKSQKDSLVIDLIVTSNVFVRFGHDTSKIAKVNFPEKITIITKKNEVETSRIHLHCLFPLKKLNKILKKELVGKIFQVKGRKVTIQKIQVVNGTHDIYIKIKHSGSIRGLFVVKGFPELSNDNKILMIKHMSFENTLEYDVFHAMGDLLHHQILMELRKYSRFDVGELMESLPVYTQKVIKKSKVAKKADIVLGKLKVDQIKTILTKNTIQLLISGHGSFIIALKKRSFMK